MIPWRTYAERYPMLIAALTHAKKNDRMAHAYLVITSNPDYRSEFPLLLAALRVCENPLPDGGPCLECSQCKQLLSGIYPDYHLLSRPRKHGRSSSARIRTIPTRCAGSKDSST